MKIRNSVRRVGNALVVAGVLSLSLVTLSQLTFQCSTERMGCLAAAVSFSGPQSVFPEMTITDKTSRSTTRHTDTTPSMADFFVETIQVTSVYIILIGVVLLVLLELRELHYLRLLTHRRKRV